MSIKRFLKQIINRRGYKISRHPEPLLRHPEHESIVEPDHIFARRMIRNPDFFFIQIGANDGITFDPLHPYIRKHNWQGIFVDPQKEYLDRLRQYYQERNGLVYRDVAIADRKGIKTLYKIRENEQTPSWAGSLASFSLDTLLKHKSHFPDIEQHITQEDVPCISLMELSDEEKIDVIDLLCIDAEGYDHEIIRSIDFQRMTIHIIMFEHIHLHQSDYNDVLNRLIDQAYKIAIGPNNTIACLDYAEDI